MADEIHAGDIGTQFTVTVSDSGVVVNLSTASTKEIILSKPSGDKLTKTASLVTDGSDGKIKYVTVANDLDVIGLWKLQVHVILPTGEWHSDVSEFRVYPNL
jgi:hypothetical protein